MIFFIEVQRIEWRNNLFSSIICYIKKKNENNKINIFIFDGGIKSSEFTGKLNFWLQFPK